MSQCQWGHRKSRSNGDSVRETGEAGSGKHQKGGLHQDSAEDRLPYFISWRGYIKLSLVLLWRSKSKKKLGEGIDWLYIKSEFRNQWHLVKFTYFTKPRHYTHSCKRAMNWELTSARFPGTIQIPTIVPQKKSMNHIHPHRSLIFTCLHVKCSI